jgi:hypothetical protein
MGELAELMPSIQTHLSNIDRAIVTVNPPDQISLHTTYQNQPLTVTYQLISGDKNEFKRQLSAALRSARQGREINFDTDVAKAVDKSTLRPHALKYLTNSKRWKAIGMTLNHQRLPAPAEIEENVIGSAVRLDEIPPQYRKMKLLGRGATTLAFEKDPETAVIFTRDSMKTDWLTHGLHMVKNYQVINPVKSYHIRGMQDYDISMIEMPKLFPLSSANRAKVIKELKEFNKACHVFGYEKYRDSSNQDNIRALSDMLVHYEEHNHDSVITPFLIWLVNYDPDQYHLDLGPRQFKQTLSGDIVLLDPVVSSELMKLFRQKFYGNK